MKIKGPVGQLGDLKLSVKRRPNCRSEVQGLNQRDATRPVLCIKATVNHTCAVATLRSFLPSPPPPVHTCALRSCLALTLSTLAASARAASSAR